MNNALSYKLDAAMLDWLGTPARDKKERSEARRAVRSVLAEIEADARVRMQARLDARAADLRRGP